jgi:hypothetical protein
MEKVIPSFQYEPLVLVPKPGTLDEEEKKGNIDGVGPLWTRTEEEEPTYIKGRRDSSQREVGHMTCIITNFKTNRIYFIGG